MKKSKAAKVLISIAMAFSLALNVFASNGSPLLETEPEPEQPESSTASPIVEEDFTKRGEYEKHFICEDGSYIAATYPYAVHEKDENGEWIDIDNSLALEDNRIENQSAANRVSFAPKAASADRIAKLEKNGHALEWSLSGTIVKPTAQKAAANFVGPMPAFRAEETELSAEAEAAIEPEEAAAKPLTVEEANAEKLRLRKLTSSVLYEDAMGEGIDVRYTVIPGKVKEDVILKQPSGFRGYTMHVNTRSLTAVKMDDNSVEFRDENDKVYFVISTPYMYDAAGEESFAIDVEVTQDEANCTITFTPDAAWLNAAERVYPVTIDPQNNQYDGANYDDTYVHEGDATGYCELCKCTHNTRDRMLAGLRNGKKHRAFFRIKDMPALPTGCTIYSANLYIYYTDGTKSGGKMVLCKTLGTFNNNMTWNTQPSYKDLETRAFYDTDSSGNRFLKFSNTTFLTELRMMYSGSEANNGFAIKAEGNETYNDYNAFYTSNSAVAYRPERPLLELTYQTPASIANGTYFIRNRNSGHYLTIPGNGGSETRAVQYAFNGATNQQWILTKNSDGYYKLEPVYNTGLALDVRGGAPTSNGQWVETYWDNGGPAQQWAFFLNGDGSYRMMSRVDNQTRCISVNGGYTTSPTNLHMWNYTGAAEQGWYLEKSNLEGLNPSANCPAVRYGGQVYFDYSKPVNVMLNGNVSECKSNALLTVGQYTAIVAVGTVIRPVSGLFEGTVTYTAYQADKFMWFFNKVNHGKEWDIKVAARWREQLPGIPYLGVTVPFYYNGLFMSAEDLGNYMYGYLGRALKMGPDMLLWGGGVAAVRNDKYGGYSSVEGYKKAMLDPQTQSPPYGDATNDTIMINKGVSDFIAQNSNYAVALNLAPDKTSELFQLIYSVIGK